MAKHESLKLLAIIAFVIFVQRFPEVLGEEPETVQIGTTVKSFTAPDQNKWKIHRGPHFHGIGMGATAITPLGAETLVQFEQFVLSLPSSEAMGWYIQSHSLNANLAKGTLMESPSGAVLGYPLEARDGTFIVFDESTGLVTLNYGLQGTVAGSKIALGVMFTADATTGTTSQLLMTDVVSGEVIEYDFPNQLVSCPTFDNCLLNCALNKLCNLIDVCELTILLAEVKVCLTTKVGCLTLLDEVLEVVACTGVDCVLQCGGGEGTCLDPINLTSGQSYTGNTSGGQLSWDSYNCSSWNESGPERVHRITLNKTGTIKAELSNLGSVDLDVFILSSCSKSKCLAAGNNTATVTVDPGTYYIMVDGYKGAVGKYTLTVDAPGQDGDEDGDDIFYESVETGTNGWSTSGLWDITTNRSNSPTHAWYYGQPGSWNYNTGSQNSGSLVSPPISLSSVSSATLSFYSWYKTEDTGTSWDKKLVQISTNGGNSWFQLAQISGTNQQWIKKTVDLSSYTGQTIRIRFRFDTVDGQFNSFEGWYIDDIRLTGN